MESERRSEFPRPTDEADCIMCSMDHALRPAPRKLNRLVLAIALASGVSSAPALAGQASTSFNVTINYVPAPASCTASVGNGGPVVHCGPAPLGPVAPAATTGTVTSGTVATALPGTPPVIITASGSNTGGGPDLLHGYRLPDTRMKVTGALVEVGEESFYAWGEYSSRIIAAGGIEYVEMTVTW